MKDMMQEIIKKYYINDQEAIIADIYATYMETNKEGRKYSPSYGISKIVNDLFTKTKDIKIQKLIKNDSARYKSEVINICVKNGNCFIIKVSGHYDFSEVMKGKTFTKNEDREEIIYSIDLIHTMNNTNRFLVVGYTENYEGELFSRSGYIATNIGKEKAVYEIIKIYRKRARQKQAIEELKNEFHHFFLLVK